MFYGYGLLNSNTPTLKATTMRGGGGGYTPLFDTYTGSQIGYSMFKLRTAYTGYCLRVRRTSDNTTQEIGFVDNYLNVADLLDFVGASNGRVVKWYDQTGSGNDLTQTVDATAQPQIVNSGSLITRNGIATIKASDTQWLNLTNTIFMNSTHHWWLSYEKNTTSNHMMLYASGSSYTFYEVGANKYVATAHFITASPNLTANNFMLLHSNFWENNTSMCRLYRNGSSIGSNATTYLPGTNTSAIATMPGSAFRNSTTAYFNEFVIFNSNKYSDISAIESNINTRNTIY
jgi:hypothetical protein